MLLMSSYHAASSLVNQCNSTTSVNHLLAPILITSICLTKNGENSEDEEKDDGVKAKGKANSVKA